MTSLKDFTIDIEMDVSDILVDVTCDEVVANYPVADLLTEMDEAKIVEHLIDVHYVDDIWEAIKDEVDSDLILKFVTDNAASFGVKVTEIHGED